MGGLTQRNQKDAIQIETRDIVDDGTGAVKKTSAVTVSGAVPQPFVMGMRIRKNQRVKALFFGDREVTDNQNDTDDIKAALEDAFPIGSGVSEKWIAFRMTVDDLPHPGGFHTTLVVTRPPGTTKFQVVPIVVAQTAGQFSTGEYLIATSILTHSGGKARELRRR